MGQLKGIDRDVKVPRWARPALTAAPGLLLLLLLLLPAAAPSRAASPAPGASPGPAAAGTPFATPHVPPCPNPTPTAAPSLKPGETPAPTAHPDLCPAQLNGGDPTSLLAFLFTPIFQTIFIVLAFAYRVTGDIGLAIIVVTLLIRVLLIPLFRKQLLSQRKMQVLQPELAAIRARYKGDRQRQQQEQMRFYQERGVNPAAGCLPSLMQLLLLMPMYYVFSSGLLAPNISSMLTVFGHEIVHVSCQDPANAMVACIQTHVAWLGGLDASKPEILFTLPGIGFGVSLLAICSALLQLVQTRMMMPVTTGDPNARTTQTTFMIIPLISIVYGAFLPAGLFIYWIVTTVFSIVQQYLTVGWGSFFPLFGWTPAFAVGHRPRFGLKDQQLLTAPKAKPSGSTATAAAPARRDPATSAAGTVRPARKRGPSSRRGRRR